MLRQTKLSWSPVEQLIILKTDKEEVLFLYKLYITD